MPFRHYRMPMHLNTRALAARSKISNSFSCIHKFAISDFFCLHFANILHKYNQKYIFGKNRQTHSAQALTLISHFSMQFSVVVVAFFVYSHWILFSWFVHIWTVSKLVCSIWTFDSLLLHQHTHIQRERDTRIHIFTYPI